MTVEITLLGALAAIFILFAIRYRRYLPIALKAPSKVGDMKEALTYGAPMDDARKEIFFKALFSRKGRVKGIALYSDTSVKLLLGVLTENGVKVELAPDLNPADLSTINSTELENNMDVAGETISDEEFLQYVKLLDYSYRQQNKPLRINVEKSSDN